MDGNSRNVVDMNKQDTQTEFEAILFMHEAPQEQPVRQDRVCLLCELPVCTQTDPPPGCTNSMLNKDYMNKDYMDIYAETPQKHKIINRCYYVEL